MGTFKIKIGEQFVEIGAISPAAWFAGAAFQMGRRHTRMAKGFRTGLAAVEAIHFTARFLC